MIPVLLLGLLIASCMTKRAIPLACLSWGALAFFCRDPVPVVGKPVGVGELFNTVMWTDLGMVTLGLWGLASVLRFGAILRPKARERTIFVLGFLFLLVAFFSALNSPETELGFWAVGRGILLPLLAAIFGIGLYIRFRNWQMPAACLLALALPAVVQTLSRLLIGGFFSGSWDAKQAYNESAAATFYGPSADTATYFIVALAFMALLAQKKPKSIWLPVAVTSSALLAICLLGSLARGAWFAGIAVLVITLPRYRRFLLAAALAVAFLAAAINVSYLTSIVRSRTTAADETSDAVRLRAFWESAEIAVQHPLLGVGPGQYINHTNTGLWYAHNLLGAIASELGLLATFVFLLLMYLISHVLSRLRGQTDLFDPAVAALAGWLIVAETSGLTYSNSDLLAYANYAPMILVGCIWGASVTDGRFRQQKYELSSIQPLAAGNARGVRTQTAPASI